MVFGKVSGGLGGPKCKGLWMAWKRFVMCLKPLDRFGVGLELTGSVWRSLGKFAVSLAGLWKGVGWDRWSVERFEICFLVQDLRFWGSGF